MCIAVFMTLRGSHLRKQTLWLLLLQTHERRTRSLLRYLLCNFDQKCPACLQVSSQPEAQEGGPGAAATQEGGPSSSGLQESEHEPTTVAADDSVYTSADRFEDLQLSEDLLKVSPYPPSLLQAHKHSLSFVRRISFRHRNNVSCFCTGSTLESQAAAALSA